MSAPHALIAARRAGVVVTVVDGDLDLKASCAPPQHILDDLKCSKPAIIAHLQARPSTWSVEDWKVFYEERAAILEYDGGFSREQAEARAYKCCITEWLDLNPAWSEPGKCAICAGRDENHKPVIPFGCEGHRHAWLHHGCHGEWMNRRRGATMEALADMGISNDKRTFTDSGA